MRIENPRSPHEYMGRLDADGTAYLIRTLRVTGPFEYSRMDVLAHSRDWLHLRGMSGVQMWVQMRHVVNIVIEELP